MNIYSKKKKKHGVQRFIRIGRLTIEPLGLGLGIADLVNQNTYQHFGLIFLTPIPAQSEDIIPDS
jgi:hypothetical protein